MDKKHLTPRLNLSDGLLVQDLFGQLLVHSFNKAEKEIKDKAIQ